MVRIIQYLSIICFATLPYIFSLQGDFVFDDTEAIIKNKDISTTSWISIFFNDFWGSSIKSNSSHKSYRPLTIMTFRLNYLLNANKLSAFQFKLTNLISHTLCCLLVLQTFEIILNNRESKTRLWLNPAYSSTLLFAVHPVHVEAVSGIVGRADILAGVAFFLSFIIYSKATLNRDFGGLNFTVAVILAVCSMLFKENGITVLGFCFVYEIMDGLLGKGYKYKKEQKTLPIGKNSHINLSHTSFIRMLLLVVSIVLILCGRWAIMGGEKPEFKPIDNPAAFSNDTLSKVTTFNYIYFLNILLLIWPQWLCYDWSMGCVPIIDNITTDYRTLTVLLIYFYGILCIRNITCQSRKHTKKSITLALALAAIPFMPAANIFYTVGFVMAERVLYIPSAGYCLLIGIGFNKIVRYTKMYKIGIILLILLVILNAARSWQRSLEWQTEYKLFISGLSVCPSNAKVHYNVAKVADAANNDEWALEEYRTAIQLYPEYYQAMNNLANLLKSQKHHTEAEHYLRTAVKLNPNFPAAWMNLGILLAGTKRYEESEDAYKTALKYRRNYPDCYYNLGNLYLELNKTDLAVNNWLEAINLNPTHNLAWTNLLALLDNTGQLKKAMDIIPIALSKLPESPSVNFAIANIYGKMDRFVDAEIYFKEAIKLFNQRVQAIHYANLGVLYHRWKKYNLAEEMYKNALKINPKFKSAINNLKTLPNKQ